MGKFRNPAMMQKSRKPLKQFKMRNLNIEDMGLQKMTSVEMTETNGGGLLTGFLTGFDQGLKTIFSGANGLVNGITNTATTALNGIFNTISAFLSNTI